MPRSERRVRVERGLYRAGRTYFACATPPGGRQAVWKTLGDVRLMEARRLRDEYVVEARRITRPARAVRATFADVAEEWLRDQGEPRASSASCSRGRSRPTSSACADMRSQNCVASGPDCIARSESIAA